MIKSININYPEFGKDGLKLDMKFTKGINIISEENGYGKSTILNTIMSIFTLKYPGLRTLPEGTATVETDNNKLILSKKNWLGIEHASNDLYQYCMPGKFFELKSTTDQRKVIVDLLGLDADSFIKERCDKAAKQFIYLKDYTSDTESNLKAKLKEFETKEVSIIEDIQRYKSELINFEEKDFKDIEEFYSSQKLIEEKVKEYNRDIITKQNEYNSLLSSVRILENNISNLETNRDNIVSDNKRLHTLLESLRDEYQDIDTNASCDKCNSKLSEDKKKSLLDKIISEAENTKAKINDNETKINNLISEILKARESLVSLNKQVEDFNVPPMLGYDDIVSNAKTFGIKFKPISELRLKEYDDYKESIQRKSVIEKELKFKEDSLREINTLEVQSSMDKLKEIKTEFTDHLQEVIKDLTLDIKLYELLKNGNLKESFTIEYKGVDYYDLSTGNKALVNIMLSKLFIDKLGLDFILIDEASNISKNNLDYIKELSNNYQVIIAKATTWDKKDFK